MPADRRSSRSSDEPIDVAATTGSSSRARTARASLRGAMTASPRRLAAVGPGTAAALADAGLDADVVADVPRRRRASSPSFPTRRARAFSSAPRVRGGCSPTSSAPTSVPLYRTRRARAWSRCRRSTRRCSPPPRPRARMRRARRSPCPAISIGPQTTAAARERPASTSSPRQSTHDVARPRRLRRGVARVHHVPDRLRPAGRLRRHLPRRDEADRARRRDHRHHARHRAAGACCRAR